MGKLALTGLKAYCAERSVHMPSADSILQMPVLMRYFWEWGQGRRVDVQTAPEDRLQLAGLKAFRPACRGCALSHYWSFY